MNTLTCFKPCCINVLYQVVFGPTPVTVVCPNGHEVTTNVSYKSGSFTFIVAALICFFLGPCCALIPFCVDGMKDVEHTCPVDGTVLGVFKRSL
jgi:lipopolysaccharide-induced tumor necrosis factor-alpha factor